MDIRIPNLGEGSDSGTVVSIMVKEGDTIAKDQTILELENEKAVAPIPSTIAGVISKLHVKVGDKVSVGHLIASIAGEGKAASPSPAQVAPQVSYDAPAPRLATPAPASQSPLDYRYASVGGVDPSASPSVRKMALELGIDLHRVKGTESGGRVGMADIRNYIQYLQQAAQANVSASTVSSPAVAAPKVFESIDFSKWGSVEKKPLTSLRQKISQKMSESWTTIPHVTQFEEVDITELMALRKKYAAAYEKKGAKLTLTSFVVKAAIVALKKFPGFNASLDESKQEMVLKNYYHIGVAVDTEQGLIVPVIKDADKKSVFEISQTIETLAEKTRARKVSPDDLKGGSFTISNLGGIGGSFFTPIINKPEVAILGVSKGVYRPIVVKGKTKDTIEAHLMMPIGLSYDHRVIDGADGARFVRALAEALENFSEKEVKL
jgi:pyruvate dehydrogenase E2 component (dihydrolipoamide acetyltransferase)